MWQSRTIVSGLIMLPHGVELQCSVKLNPFGAFQQVGPSEKKIGIGLGLKLYPVNLKRVLNKNVTWLLLSFMRETKSWEQKQSSSRLVSPYASDVINFNFYVIKIYLLQECESDLKAGEPLMQDAILYGRELTQDDLFDADEKENITRDMAQLQEHYDELRNFVDDEQEGFVMLFSLPSVRSRWEPWMILISSLY